MKGCNSFTACDVVHTEKLLLNALQFELASATPLQLLHALLAHARADGGSGHGVGALGHAAAYILELALCSPPLPSTPPSAAMLAAAALALAARLLQGRVSAAGRAAATRAALGLAAAVGQPLPSLVETLAALHARAQATVPAPHARVKFSTPLRARVALLPPRPSTRWLW